MNSTRCSRTRSAHKVNASAQTGASIQARDENLKGKLMGAFASAEESENPEPNTRRIELISEENRGLAKGRAGPREKWRRRSRPRCIRGFLIGTLLVNRSEEHTSELQSLRHLVC